jgi:hypothetical protein
MHVHVQIQRPAEALDDHDGPATAIDDPVPARTPTHESQHAANGDAHDGATEVVIPGQEIPKPMRETQDPLTNGHVGEHVIDEMCRAVGHPAPGTTGTKATAFTRERDQAIGPTARTPKPCEATGQLPAPQEIAELLLNEAR